MFFIVLCFLSVFSLQAASDASQDSATDLKTPALDASVGANSDAMKDLNARIEVKQKQINDLQSKGTGSDASRSALAAMQDEFARLTKERDRLGKELDAQKETQQILTTLQQQVQSLQDDADMRNLLEDQEQETPTPDQREAKVATEEE